MNIKQHALAGVVEMIPRVFTDARGAFFESFNAQRFAELTGIEENWVQDNHSISTKGVLRGLHFQLPPHAQAKLVRVAFGRSLDVVVDIRRDSPTYGQHVKVMLDAENYNMLYVPRGFAHGFLALEDNNVFLYKCTDYYHPESEGGLCWNDPALNIDWGVENPNVSPKDAVLPRLADFNSPF
ncbi:dTDP-4-dehydrorhamnose 3,5-epimerase [Hymenobacter koreensis]|uniref:dTDP-4-dehydrorhamnose 3,5-epimerase n=1 Tax=Hymenobacter koreensis TaxID=1084523 RepID=A0ABP8JML4_9BACT